MSEPRRLNTGSAEQSQYEEARRQAQQQSAVRGGRRARRIQTNNVHPVTEADQVRIAAAAQAAIEAQAGDPQPELTRAQQQAIALQRAAAQRRSRAINTPSVQRVDLNKAQGGKPVYDIDNDPAFSEQQRRTVRRAASAPAAQAGPTAPQAAARRPAPVQRAARSQPARPAAAPAPQPQAERSAALPRDPDSPAADPKRPARKPAPQAKKASGGGGKPPKKGGGKSSGKGAGDGKKKKKGGWWKVLLATLLVIVVIVFGTFTLIMQALKPETGGSITLDQLLNTPKEYAGKEFNVLLVGIDRSSEDENNPDAEVNDGMTDMIMWLHFNNETGEVKMLQIPRNIFVSKQNDLSSNYQINAIAKTQGSNGYNDINALCTYVANAFQVPIDGYITIRLEKLVELVDILGGIQVYVPYEMYDPQSGSTSHLDQGYQTLDGAACEFFLRTRHMYANSDLGRLNTQRYFYAALFAKLKSMNVWNIAKNLPFYLSMVETSLDAGQIVSVAVSLLKVPSENIMLAQVPVYMGSILWPADAAQPNDVVVVARQETADLLNTYYRENTGPVDASELGICDGDNAPDYSGRSPSDPNVKFMGELNAEAADAMENNNLDGSGTNINAGEFVYDVPDETDSGDTVDTGEAEPAA